MRQKKQTKMFTLVEEWKASKETKQAFCKAHQVNPTTFHYWIQKYNKYNLSADSPAAQNTPFVALSIREPKGTIEQVDQSMHKGVELNYPNGVHLRLNGPINISYLSSLIKISI